MPRSVSFIGSIEALNDRVLGSLGLERGHARVSTPVSTVSRWDRGLDFLGEKSTIICRYMYAIVQ